MKTTDERKSFPLLARIDDPDGGEPWYMANPDLEQYLRRRGFAWSQYVKALVAEAEARGGADDGVSITDEFEDAVWRRMERTAETPRRLGTP